MQEVEGQIILSGLEHGFELQQLDKYSSVGYRG